jgi:ATP-dependent DNA helicase RecG
LRRPEEAVLDFNARHFMEMAVEEMRKSIAEARTDGKASPKVGAVLVHVGDEVPAKRRVEVAHRGELREGDHAEFTLLERKNRDKKLDQCVLFATLEPCAPNARKHPKLGCAERIVLARINQVWVGIEDPDPTVDRKGIKFLQESGVTVHMFDRDLQEIIREENKEFIAQAQERAASYSERQPREVTLSPLENAVSQHSSLEDLSLDALEAYRSKARIADEVGSPAFSRRLAQQGLLGRSGEFYHPTGFGILLFGKEPRVSMPQAGLLASIHYPNGSEEVQDFEGPQVFVPDKALAWIRAKLPNVIARDQAQRREISGPLFEVVREGIVNALVHRDYSNASAKCHLIVTPDKIEIRSPGKPVEPITLEQLQSLRAPMLSRNPVLHYVFARLELAEERGLGLKSMQARTRELNLPLPRFSWEEPYLVLSIFRSPEGVTTSLPETIQGELSAPERKGWQWFATRGRSKSSEYAKAMEVDARTARRHLNRFVELGLARTSGSARSTIYETR